MYIKSCASVRRDGNRPGIKDGGRTVPGREFVGDVRHNDRIAVPVNKNRERTYPPCICLLRKDYGHAFAPKSLGAGVSLAQDATTYADFTEELITWYGGTIFTPGYVARITTQDKELQEWSPQWIREGVVVSRKIVTADRTPYLEVIIQPTHQGWAHKVMSNLGTGTSTNALISPAAGPVPFVFTTFVSSENVTKTGALNIQIYLQYTPPASPSVLKNVSSASSFYDGEMRTEIIQYEGIPITKGEQINLVFNSMFPLKSTVKITPLIAGHPGRLITLGDYIKNYDPSQAPAALGAMSSPSIFLPGGNCTYYLTGKFIIRQDSTDTEITPGGKYIQYEEIVTL